MAASEQSPHDHETVTTGGPYYRQVHPNNFQDGRALSPAFVLQDTGCHFTLSLKDGSRTTAARCHREYTQQDGRQAAAVLEVSPDELAASGSDRVVDAPNEQTHAHVDAMCDKPMSRCQQRNAAQALVAAANRRGPAIFPRTDKQRGVPTPGHRQSRVAKFPRNQGARCGRWDDGCPPPESQLRRDWRHAAGTGSDIGIRTAARTPNALLDVMEVGRTKP